MDQKLLVQVTPIPNWILVGQKLRFRLGGALTFLLLAAAGWLPCQSAVGARIIVGQVSSFSGINATQARAYAAGMELYFNSINGTQAVGGHTFSLVRKDDGGNPIETVALTKKMLAEDRPMVLTGYSGNENVNQLVASGLLEAEKVSLIGYRTTEMRAETPFVYSVRADLREEIKKLTEHLATIGITRLGLFYEEGPTAKILLAAADDAAQKANAVIVVNAAYPTGTTRIAAAINAFTAKQPQAIIMIANAGVSSSFIEQYRTAGGIAQLFSHSGADIEQLAKRLSEEQMQGLAIAQVTPSPYRISSRLSKEFQDNFAKSKNNEVPASYSMMDGYITAKVIVEAVRRQGTNHTRQGLAAALDAMSEYDLGGFLISYRPGTRTGSRFVELSIISSAGRIRQ